MTEIETHEDRATRVTRVDVYATGQLALTLRQAATEVWVCDLVRREIARAAERPEKTQDPPAVQKLFREHLGAATLASRSDTPYGAVWAFIHKNGSTRTLHMETRALVPRAVLCQQKQRDGAPQRIVAVVGSKRAAGRDLKKGRIYAPPTEMSDAPGVGPASPSAPSEAPAGSDARRRTKKERKRLERLLKGLARDARRLGDPAAHYENGERLKPLLSEISPGQRAVTDPDTGLVIELDPARTAAENLERIFAAAKRAKRGQERIAARRAEVQRALDALDAFVTGHGEDLDDDAVTAFLGVSRQKHRGAAPRVRAQKRRPYRAFRRDGGEAILVGRSAKDNDALTFRVARGRDTWLHARGVTGSHVVVRRPLETLDSQTLVDAAHLAVHFSSARGQSRADVTYTSRRHLKKPGKGAAPGLVLVSEERVVHVNVDEARLRALLEAEVAADTV